MTMPFPARARWWWKEKVFGFSLAFQAYEQFLLPKAVHCLPYSNVYGLWYWVYNGFH